MTALRALQDTLAAEHAALHLYGVFGGRTSQSAEPVLFEAVSTGHATHRTRRDDLELAIRALGETPVAAAATYALPGRLGSPREVSRAALDTERACAEAYSALVANTVAERRRWAVETLVACALQQLRLGGRPEPFPGAPELG